jgi:hypothetical protein
MYDGAVRMHEFVSWLSECRAQLEDRARRLSGDASVRSVTTTVESRTVNDGHPRLDLYLDAELASGNAIAWLLNCIWRDGTWEIDSEVVHQTSNGQDELIALPNRYAVDDEKFMLEVNHALRALVTTIEGLDLSTI